MHLSISFVVATLALSVTASPIEAHIGTKGVKTPLSRRLSLTNADGTVNIDKLRNSTEFTIRCVLISRMHSFKLTMTWLQQNPEWVRRF
jgi:hypothetical protein